VILLKLKGIVREYDLTKKLIVLDDGTGQILIAVSKIHASSLAPITQGCYMMAIGHLKKQSTAFLIAYQLKVLTHPNRESSWLLEVVDIHTSVYSSLTHSSRPIDTV